MKMKTIAIDFKGYIEVDKEDIALMMSDGTPIDKSSLAKLSGTQVVEGLKDGTYMIDFMQCYMNALDGHEDYEFQVVEFE